MFKFLARMGSKKKHVSIHVYIRKAIKFWCPKCEFMVFHWPVIDPLDQCWSRNSRLTWPNGWFILNNIPTSFRETIHDSLFDFFHTSKPSDSLYLLHMLNQKSRRFFFPTSLNIVFVCLGNILLRHRVSSIYPLVIKSTGRGYGPEGHTRERS